MASGLVCRANRPNTWLHRPACKREEKPCQLGAVHTWHFSAVTIVLSNVCYRGNGGHVGERFARFANDQTDMYSDQPKHRGWEGRPLKS